MTRLYGALGRPALDTLAVQVAATKAADPFAPVTVVVATNRLGVFLRRHLGRNGVVNLDVVTFAALADRIARDLLAADGALPLRRSELAEAARAVLRDDPGPFAAFVDDPGFLQSLAASLRLLARVPPASRRSLEDHPGDPGGRAKWERLRHLLRLRDAVDARLAGRLDAPARLATATRRLRDEPACAAGLGSVIVYAPGPLDVADTAFVTALSDAVATTVVLALTGDKSADAAVLRAFGSDGALFGLDEGIPTVTVTPARRHVIVAADPEEEVRTVVRAIARRLVDGYPLYGTAVLYPAAEPYARLVHQHLAAAGLPHFGPQLTTLASSTTGQALIGFVDAVAAGLDRSTVFGWLASVPVRVGPDARRAPTALWSELAMAAGVTRAGTWAERLARIARARRADADAESARLAGRGDAETSYAMSRLRREADAADELAAWVATMQAFAERLARASDWATVTATLRDVLVWAFGTTTAPMSWVEAERSADDKVRGVIDEIASLDGIGAEPQLADIRRVLEDELAVADGHIGRHGDGVWFGPLSDAIGVALDTVYVLGLAEGSLPRPTPRDPLLGGATGLIPNLPERDVATDDLRAFLAAQACADEVVYCVPSVDVRQQVVCRPSPLLLRVVADLAGHEVASEDLARLDPDRYDWFHHVPSFQAGLLRSAEPLDSGERDVRAILAARASGADPTQLEFLGAEFLRRRPYVARRQLGRDAWGPWSGQAGPVPGHVLGRAFSPTALESYVGCPRRFLFGTVLGIRVPDVPDDTGDIDARVRGAIIHEVLETFAQQRLIGCAPTGQGEPSLDDVAEMARIVDDVCGAYAAQGRVGIAVSWEATQRRISRMLRDWLEVDARRRAATGTQVHAVEFAFGMPGPSAPALTIELASGEVMRLRGKGDRVDVGDDRVVVYDYKSGKADRYRIPADDPVDGGRRLQLPAYAAAAQRLRPHASVTAGYWFVEASAEPDKQVSELAADATVMDRFREVLDRIRGDIAAGLFPPHPSDGCRFCDFAAICPSSRDAQWQAAAASPDLAAHRALIEGTDRAGAGPDVGPGVGPDRTGRP